MVEVSKSDEKEKRILELEQQIAKNDFNNHQLLKEIKILFPKINALTVSNNNFAQGDSLVNKTILIYTAEAQFSNEEEQKLKNWIEQRLNINNVQIFK